MHGAKNGDVIRVNRHGAYYHYGIYVDGGRVIHYNKVKGEYLKGTVMETSLEEFLDGEDRYEVYRLEGRREYSGSETVRRARSKIGRKGYNLFWNNCEHFAVWCRTGKKKSSQTSILSNLMDEMFGF